MSSDAYQMFSGLWKIVSEYMQRKRFKQQRYGLAKTFESKLVFKAGTVKNFCKIAKNKFCFLKFHTFHGKLRNFFYKIIQLLVCILADYLFDCTCTAVCLLDIPIIRRFRCSLLRQHKSSQVKSRGNL